MKHLDDKQFLAYLARRRTYAELDVRREATLHIVKCTKCSSRLKEIQRRQRDTEARKRQSRAADEALEDTGPPTGAHLADRQLSSYLNYHDEFSDPEIRGAFGDHVSRCNECSERLVEARKQLRLSGELRLNEPEILTTAGLRPGGRLSPAPIYPSAISGAPTGTAPATRVVRPSGEQGPNGDRKGGSPARAPSADAAAADAARQEAEAARKEVEAARRQAEAAIKEAEAARREAEAAIERQAAAAARKEVEAARQREADAARTQETTATRGETDATRRELAAARRDAEAARKEAEAAKREAESARMEAQAVRAAAQRMASVTAQRKVVDTAKTQETEAAVKMEAEVARKEAEVAKTEADAARKEADAARREAEAARKEAAAVKEAARKMARASRQRREAEAAQRQHDETVKRDEAAAARKEAEAAKKEAEVARRDAEAAKQEAAAVKEAAKKVAEAARRRESATRSAVPAAEEIHPPAPDAAAAEHKAAQAALKEAEAARKLAEAAKKEAEAARAEANAARKHAEAMRNREEQVPARSGVGGPGVAGEVPTTLTRAVAARAGQRQPPARRGGRRWPLLVALIPVAAGAGWFAQSLLGSGEAGDAGGETVAAAPGALVLPPADSTLSAPAEVVPPDTTITTEPPVTAAPARPVATAQPPVTRDPAPRPAAVVGDPPPATRVAAPPPARRVLLGSVRAEGNNQPLAGARVAVSGTGIAVVTDAAGAFRLADLPAGNMDIVATHSGYLQQRVTTAVPPGADQRLDFRLQQDVPVAAPPPEPPEETGPRTLPTRQETDPELVSGAWSRIQRSEAEELLGRTLVAVSGLPIESLAKPGSPSRRGVRIAQTLESGGRIELVITRPPFLSRSRGGAEATSVTAVRVAEPAAGSTSVTGTARLGAYLITAKADVDPAQLNALLNRITEASP